MKMNVLACLLLLSNVCHAAIVTSNGTGGGAWSEPGTWAEGAVPADGDTVIIVTSDIVTFDVDMSGWQNGIAGLTCNGTMDCTTSIGTYCLKTSADIGGTGRVNCGSSETAYPSNCTMTFDFDSKPNTFVCGSGLTLNLYCTEPNHPVVALSGAAPAGQTELPVDTDVSGDIWTPGKTVRIDGISGSLPDSEKRVISMGGVASDSVTVDVGLTNAKVPGARVVLITRNIRIIGSAAYAIRYMTGGVLGCEISNSGVGIGSSSSCTIFGTISGCNSAVSSCSVSTISGTVSGCYTGVTDLFGGLVSGTISGCSYGVQRGSDSTISGTISGCNVGMDSGPNVIQDAVFGGNNYDLRRVGSLTAYNTLFESATENYEYDTANVPPWTYVASYDHDGVTGAFKAWTQGGVVVSDVDVAPAGYATSYWHKCMSSTMPCFRQELITVGPGRTLEVRGQILILDNQELWPPRLELIDVRADPLVDAGAVPLASAVIPKPLGRYAWQDVTVRYTNTDAISTQIWIRCSAKQSGNDIYEVWTARLP